MSMQLVNGLISANISQTLVNQAIWQNILLNVMAEPYSATGDGTTDDTEAIQDAIDDAIAAGKKAIYFPHPTVAYYVTSLDNADQVVFFGDNATFTGGYSGEIAQIGFANIQQQSSGSFLTDNNYIRFAEIPQDVAGVTSIWGLFEFRHQVTALTDINVAYFTVMKVKGIAPTLIILHMTTMEFSRYITAFATTYHATDSGATMGVSVLFSSAVAGAQTYTLKLLAGNTDWDLITPEVDSTTGGYTRLPSQKTLITAGKSGETQTVLGALTVNGAIIGGSTLAMTGESTFSSIAATSQITASGGYIDKVETIAGTTATGTGTALAGLGLSLVNSTAATIYYTLTTPLVAGQHKYIALPTALTSTGRSVIINSSGAKFDATNMIATLNTTTKDAGLELISTSATQWQVMRNTGTWGFSTS